MMNGRGKSDRLEVPGKPPNAGELAAEAAEGSGRAKGNSPERKALRTQSRGGAQSARAGTSSKMRMKYKHPCRWKCLGTDKDWPSNE
jgi:hypothetical protein